MTLTELSYYVRKAAPLLLIFTLILFIFYYSIKLIFLLTEKPKTPNLLINPIFDKIEKPILKQATLSGGLSYILDNIEGKPVTATLAAKVFFVPEPQARLTYRSRILLMAKQFGFDTDITKYKLINDEAFFSDSDKKLSINIKNYNFQYEYDFGQHKEIFIQATLPQEKDIEQKTIDFLKSIDRYPEDLAKGKINILYFNYQSENNSISPSSFENANIVELDFFPQDVDKYPVFYEKFQTSPNHVIATFINSEIKILKAKISYFEKTYDQYGVYPLKTGDQAYEELISGKGLIITNESKEKQITINKMFLSYLDLESYFPYFQPVYVFLGSDNFVAYVFAVSNDYLK